MVFYLAYFAEKSPLATLRADKRLEAGDYVEKFFVDATLTQTVKCALEILQQFVDVGVRRYGDSVDARDPVAGVDSGDGRGPEWDHLADNEPAARFQRVAVEADRKLADPTGRQ